MVSADEKIDGNSEEMKVTPEVIKTAVAAGLVYVLNNQPGYSRQRNSEGFDYMDGKKKLRDKYLLARITSLVLPPAWENVWICKLDNGHLQATGFDQLNRKQYRYHHLWNSARNQTKFYRLRDFGKCLPAIRANLEKDLTLVGFPKKKYLQPWLVCSNALTSG